MRQATPASVRIAVLVLAACLGAATSTASAAVTTYDSLSSFLGALGELAPVSHEHFDQFEAGTIINDQVDGVLFSSPFSDQGGYVPLRVQASTGSSSQPNVLSGGFLAETPVEVVQTVQVDFGPSITAFSFYLTDYNPSASAATVRLVFDNETSEAFSLSNQTEFEDIPVFFGATSDLPIMRVLITSGFLSDGFEEFGIDDLRFLAGSVRTLNPPVCQGAPSDAEGVRGIDGTATDQGELETGIERVFLGEGAVNLTLNVTSFDPGSEAVTFRVTQTDPSLDAQGRVFAVDGEEKICTLSASFRALGPGPLEGETICRDGGLLLAISNASSTPAGTSACSASLPGGDEPAFPPGYVPSDPDDPFPCQVFTIDSPVSGETEMILKKDGDFDPNLRLLFSHSELVGGELVFPPFTDVTEFVEQIATVIPDPTRVRGSVEWSPVKVSCGTQSAGALLAFCGALPSGDEGPDADGDGFRLCAASALDRDCNDQIDDVSPDAGEVCNGLDDNCDGAVDEETPAGIACPVDGLRGACRQGMTSCATLPMACVQTVFPVDEVACNGVDDDCDGQVDGTYQFSGYLAPINPDGSTVFIKRRGAIPVKFQLRTCSGAFVDDAVATIQVFFHSSGVVGDEEIEVSSVGRANSGNLYRFDPESHQYIYNLDASSLQQNSSYIIRTRLDDGSVHDVLISIK